MKTTIQLLKTILENGLRGLIKYIYIGDPTAIPASCLPALILNPVRTNISLLDSARDNNTYNISISLVIDARQYLNATPDKMVGTDFLMETMEGEDSAGALNVKTILSIIRKNLNLGTNRRISNDMSIDYTVRKRTDDLITLEVVANIEVAHFTTR